MADTKRSLQHVVPLSSRIQCVEWMEIDVTMNGEKGLCGRAVSHFPALFRSDNRRVNLNKARDWWSKRAATNAKIDEKKQLKYASSVRGTRQQFVVKAVRGRGRKLEAQWDWLYPLLLSEFERLRRAGVKFSARLVRDMATVLIEDSTHPIYIKGLIIKGVPFREKVTEQRIQDFLERFDIVYRRLKGNKQVSEEKQQHIDLAIAAHLGRLKRQFDDKTIDPNQIYNMDESHFVIDLDDGKTLDFQGAEEVKYRKIVSGREGITMCVLLKGGSNSKILCPMLIFKNVNSSHPIQGLPDAVDGVCYRSTPSAFINNVTMTQWLHDVRCWGPGGPFVGERILWMDNASGHSGQDVQVEAK
ncbi:hypothetical protein PR003_g30588 [Phytophthora rubi]|uniref:DDE-1 domain-containing protein n=1 Tax=Phytophthora rubi TaxID=129364 RepID=A0A6A4BD43_9STRA|nr:hypothetical protein PR001_g29566 [Phytophthora rubi]KAE9271176.1 hypothetical protein PR003_g30588 [Phytophthora rubi]